MNTRKVRGIALTGLGLGGGSLGNLYRATSDEDARAAVDAAWAGGVRYYDTAPHYGLGLSESRLGAALADRPRDAYVLSTKVGRLLEPNPKPTGSDLAAGGFDVVDTLRRRFDFSASGVRRSLESSLERLGVDRVDIAYVHDPDAYVDAAITGAIPELIRMRDEGTVGAVGVGMNQWQAPLRMVEETEVDVVMLAGRWTLLDRTGERLLDQCALSGVAVVAAAPFNSGLLAVDEPADGAYFDYGPASPDILAQARRLAEICRRHGTTLPAAALQFPLRHPAVASVVCGMRTAEQVASTLERFAAGIPESAWAELDGGLHD